MRTPEEIRALKENWKSDPCYDLYAAEGFEEHEEELRQYQRECEEEWERRRLEKEKQIDEEAEKLGLAGMYRLLLKHKELLQRHDDAIEVLANEDTEKAYRLLKGYKD